MILARRNGSGIMVQSKARHAPPRASAMIESLRGLGYSASTAIADLIDNCISAGEEGGCPVPVGRICLLYTSDAADE